MNSETIFENAALLVIGRMGLPGGTIVVFSAIMMRSGEKARWETGFFKNNAGNIVAIIPKGKNYFPLRDMREAAAKIPNMDAPVVLYGSSMGAYGALKHSKLLNAHATIAFSPQYSISPHEAPYDKYRHAFYDAPSHGDMAIVKDNVLGVTAIIYDDKSRIDALHARKIFDELGGEGTCMEIKVPYAGHQLISIVSENKILNEVIKATLRADHKFLHGIMRSGKKTSSVYLENFSSLLSAKGKISIANGMLERARQHTKRPYHLDLIMARIKNSAGQKTEAIKTALLAFEGMPKPGNPEIPFFIGELYLSTGNAEMAAKFFEITLSFDNRLSKYHRFLGKALNTLEEYRKSQSVLSAATKMFPGDHALMAQYAWTLLHAGEGERAEEVFYALSQHPSRKIDVSGGLRAVKRWRKAQATRRVN
jgi:thioredoxin-like negative regulator of GroEL